MYHQVFYVHGSRYLAHGTSLMRNRRPPEPILRILTRALKGFKGGWAFSYERGTPVHSVLIVLTWSLPQARLRFDLNCPPDGQSN